MNALQRWFGALADRERRFVLFGGAAAAAVLILALVLPLNRSVAAAEQRVLDKREDLAWLRSMAPQLAALGPTQAAGSGESLVVLADRVAQSTGIGRSLTGSQPSGNGGLRVRFEKVPFDALATWMGQLSQQHGVGIESASVDSLPAPGQVNATLILRNQ